MSSVAIVPLLLKGLSMADGTDVCLLIPRAGEKRKKFVDIKY